jgi:hypothetical protein
VYICRNSLSTTTTTTTTRNPPTNKRKTNVFSGGSGDNSGQVDAVYLYRSAKIDKKKVPYDIVMQDNRVLIQNKLLLYLFSGSYVQQNFRQQTNACNIQIYLKII